MQQVEIILTRSLPVLLTDASTVSLSHGIRVFRSINSQEMPSYRLQNYSCQEYWYGHKCNTMQPETQITLHNMIVDSSNNLVLYQFPEARGLCMYFEHSIQLQFYNGVTVLRLKWQQASFKRDAASSKIFRISLKVIKQGKENGTFDAWDTLQDKLPSRHLYRPVP